MKLIILDITPQTSNFVFYLKSVNKKDVNEFGMTAETTDLNENFFNFFKPISFSFMVEIINDFVLPK